MLTLGNKKVKLFVGSTPVKEAYLGNVKVYPNTSLAITASLAFEAAGGSLALSIQVEDGQPWSIGRLPAGWAASATSGNGPASVTITAPNNTTTAPKSGTITVISEDLSATCAISQAAGVMSEEWSGWGNVSLSLAANFTEIAAAGGTATITTKANQTRNLYILWNDITTETIPEARAVTVSPSLSSNNGAFVVSGPTTVYCNSRGTVGGGQLDAIITATYAGLSGTVTLHQQANNIESYNYQVVVTSSGSTIAWSGGNTVVRAKSQRAATYTSEATGGYENTTAQTISASVYPSPFAVSYQPTIDGFVVSVGATSQASQRTATVTFTGSIGGSATTTVRQAAMPYYGEFRYTGTNQASKNPRCAVNGNPDQTRQYYSYWEALKGVNGNAVTYYNGTCQASQGTGDVDAYVFFGYDSGWGVNGLGFKSGKQMNFMNNYPYSYVTVYFEVIGETSSGWPHGALPGMALFEKSYGDFTYGWPPSSMFSAAEARAMSLLAENGAVTAADDPEIADVDFAALAEKINAMREPDTNSYTQNEDGTWTVTPPHKS